MLTRPGADRPDIPAWRAPSSPMAIFLRRPGYPTAITMSGDLKFGGADKDRASG